MEPLPFYCQIVNVNKLIKENYLKLDQVHVATWWGVENGRDLQTV